jgi:hypothetical protein
MKFPRIKFTKNYETYFPDKKFGKEIVFFPWGYIISETSDELQCVETYNVESDKVESTFGYSQNWVAKRLENWKIKDANFRKTFPKKVWEKVRI